MRQFSTAREGYGFFRGYKTRFRVIGKNRSRQPLLCIHGGPGYGFDYLQPLEEIAGTGRQVVFYDQFGCGASDLPGGEVEWSMALFLEELGAVRAAAGLGQCHVLGHGWGGMVALEYALSRPHGLLGLVLSSTVGSVPQWRGQLEQLVAGLPEDIRVPLQAHARAGTTESAACRSVLDAFERRHLCRMNPWPDCLQRSIAEARAHPEARRALLGASELAPGGVLQDWDVTHRLEEIQVPTMVTCGRHDLAPPAAAATLYRGIPGSDWVVLEHSAHMPHLEEPQRYLEVLDGFLEKAEVPQRQPA